MWGSITEAATGRPVPGVSVIHENIVVTTSDADGAFRTPPLPVEDGAIRLAFRRIGYAPAVRAVAVPRGATVAAAVVELSPAPEVLQEIEVEGEPMVVENPGLVGFYRRRAEDFGRYLTEAEIERAKGFDLSPYLRRLRVPPACSPMIPLAVYLDGIRVSDLAQVNDLIPPNQLGGIEYYGDERRAQLPPEFIPAGPVCGVILFWTRRPKGPSFVELGAHVVRQTVGSSTTVGFVGARIALPLRRESSLSFQAAADAALDDGSHRWRFHLAVTFRPLGYATPWYLGGGVSLAKRHPAAVSESDAAAAASPSLLTGVSVTAGFLRPFVEIRAVDPTSFSSGELLLATGVNLHLGPR